SNSLADDSNYAYIQTRLDPENIADYNIVNIYAGNNDWPQNNTMFWRKRTAFAANAPYGQDGRWRGAIQDTDFGFGGNLLPSAYEMDMLAFATSTGGDPVSNPEWSTFLLRSMLDNDAFKTYFINRFADLINTAYLPNRVNTVIDQMKAAIEPEIEEHWQRWNNISSLGNWQAKIDIMTDFATNRPDFQRDHIRAKFNIARNVTATLDCNHQHGFIKMNTIEISSTTPGVSENPYPW